MAQYDPIMVNGKAQIITDVAATPTPYMVDGKINDIYQQSTGVTIPVFMWWFKQQGIT
jgi:hypothetical protein